uniref:hypothetical protein n=1 Tax=Alloprevotella sp. TaxID=1872471 RepID=UPI004028B6F0
TRQTIAQQKISPPHRIQRKGYGKTSGHHAGRRADAMFTKEWPKRCGCDFSEQSEIGKEGYRKILLPEITNGCSQGFPVIPAKSALHTNAPIMEPMNLV